MDNLLGIGIIVLISVLLVGMLAYMTWTVWHDEPKG